MAHDDDHPLADWLGRPKSAPADPRLYEAYHPLDRRQLRVHVRPRNQAWEWLPYAYLQRIVTEADNGTRVALLWTFAVVVIEGRNLQGLDYALAQENIDFLRAFDPDRFNPPSDSNAPFIEKIEIHVHDVPERIKAEIEGERRH